MPYRRHLRCPLLTTHGHVIMLLHKEGSLRRGDIEAGIDRAEITTGRLLRELSGEGLIQSERAGGTTWWSLVPEKMTVERLVNDRQGDSS